MSNVKDRVIEINSKKGGKEVTITQITDIHISAVNEEDLKNREIADTYNRRQWLRDAAALPNFDASLKYAENSDCIVLSGDVLDYWTTAGEAILKERFNKYKNIMACVGGHDLTLEMETENKNALPIEERYAILNKFWCNDIQYASKTFENKVTVAVINDNVELWREYREAFDEKQYEMLLKDVEDARKNNRIMLLFMHEPINTGRGNEKVFNPASNREIEIRENIKPGSIADKTYQLIINSADVIKGVFAGHHHIDHKTEIEAGYTENGKFIKENIPMYILLCNAYTDGHVLTIKVK